MYFRLFTEAVKETDSLPYQCFICMENKATQEVLGLCNKYSLSSHFYFILTMHVKGVGFVFLNKLSVK